MEDEIEEFKQQFRENLRQYRENAGYTQVELSEKAEFDASYMGKLERGDANPSMKAIRRVCEILEITPQQLLLDVDVQEVGDALELQTHEVELEMQNEELTRVENQLRRLKNQYHALYDRAPVAFVSLDEEGTILEGNQRFRDRFAEGSSAIVDEHINGFVHPEDRDDLYRYRNAVHSDDSSEPLVLRFLGQEETVLPVEVDATLLEDPYDAPRLLLAVHDISRWVDGGGTGE